jgi:prevent-host-death family protein
VRIVTAAQASRSLARLLDQVEAGETVVVTRGGRRVATITAAPAGNGAQVLALLTESGIDEDFANDVAAARPAGRPGTQPASDD